MAKTANSREKIIIESGDGGLTDFLEYAFMYDYNDAVIAIFDSGGQLQYENPSFKNLQRAFNITKAHPELEDAYSFETLTAQVLECASQSLQACIPVKLYISLNIATNITIKLTPICNKDSNVVLGVMFSIAEENIAFADFNFVGEQHKNEDLKSQIKILAKSIDEQSHLIKALLHETPFAIILLDNQRQIVNINRACEQLLNVSARQAIGQSCDTYLDCFRASSGKCMLLEAEETAYQQESIAYCVGGEQKQVLRSTVKLGNAGDSLILEAFIDITDRKLAEAELLLHRDNLERLVRDRTKELVIARDESERANKAKSDFLSRMSHELRTPLNAIIGFSQLLEMDMAPDTEQYENLKHISSAGDHLLLLISELLDLSQIEAGAIDINIEKVAVTELVVEVMHYVEDLASKREITLSMKKSANELYIQADRLRYKEILLNILSNAVKYNLDKGEVAVNISILDEESVCVEVTDTGPGISEENIKILCEPFNRLGAEYTDVEGSGMGMSIVQQLVELMKGQLQIESTVGEGSTFKLIFPLSNQ